VTIILRIFKKILLPIQFWLLKYNIHQTSHSSLLSTLQKCFTLIWKALDQNQKLFRGNIATVNF